MTKIQSVLLPIPLPVNPSSGKNGPIAALSQYRSKFLSRLDTEFDPLIFFCPVHHSSPVNAWVWPVGCKKQTIFSVYFVVAAVPYENNKILHGNNKILSVLLKNWGVKSFLFNFIFLL